MREGKIRRLIINLPPRHLKSLFASIAFPAWCLGHDPSAQILCVSYAQDLADKLARDCRGIMISPVLSFPAIAESDEVHRIETIWGRRCFTRRKGEALHLDREPLGTLDHIRRTIGEYNFASISKPPPRWAAVWSRRNGSSVTATRKFRSNSTASCRAGYTPNKATELSDFSVCTTWGVKGVFRRRIEYPALKRAVREHQMQFGATQVLIEDKASGTQLIQELIADGCYAVTRYQPTTDKIMRLHGQPIR